MSEAADRFRDRARDCLNLAKGARYEGDRIMLEEIAADLEDEAKRIDAEERLNSSKRPPVENDRQD